MSLHRNPIESLLRTYRTARHLRGSQVVWRLRRLAATRLPLPSLSPRQSSLESSQPIEITESFPRLPEFSRGCLPSIALLDELQRSELTLVNQTLPLTADSPDWRLGEQTSNRLWIITLHYHAWLYELSKLAGANEQQSVEADVLLRTFLNDWLRACAAGQPGVEALAWNSYAIATRLGWWTRIWHSLGSGYWSRNSDLAERMSRSMYAQAAHLASNLEWDLRANHLLRDAVGLAWAGRFFRGREASNWLRTATRLAVAQAAEQVLPDGGHFERSPMYHLEVMDDFAALVMLVEEEPARQVLRDAWVKMAEYIDVLQHPDGTIPLFNDAAPRAVRDHLECGTAIGCSSAAWAASVQGSPLGRLFESTGVAAWRGSPWTVFFDVGEVGPRYQPGHAHADTLTLECSLGEQKLFVDPGCHSYDCNAIREYDRSTAAHNTVTIDHENSSEVWHIFRVGRRAVPANVSARFSPQEMFAHASHNGYRHLGGSPSHARTVEVRQHGTLEIHDSIEGRGRHAVEGGFLLAPGWSVEPQADGWRLRHGASAARVILRGSKDIATSEQRRAVHHGYGNEDFSTRIQWQYEGELPLSVRITIVPQP